MRKITVLILAAVMCFGLLTVTGCSSNDGSGNGNVSPQLLSQEYNAEEYLKIPDIKDLGISIDEAEILKNLDMRIKQYVAEDVSGSGGKMNEITTGTVDKGDTVAITFVGTLKDGSQPDNMKTAEGQTSTVTLGSGSMIPGFEEGIFGMTVGQTKKVEVVFPEVYPNNPALQNEPATFDITVVKKLEPVIDEEFLSKKEEYNTEEEYYAGIEKKLREMLVSNAKNSLPDQIYSAILAKTEVIKLPEGELEKEKEALRAQLDFFAKIRGVSKEDLLKEQNSTVEEYEAGLDKSAESAVKSKLIFSHLAKKNDVKVTDEEIRQQTSDFFKGYGITDEKTFKEQFNGCTYDEYIESTNLGYEVLISKILENLSKQI